MNSQSLQTSKNIFNTHLLWLSGAPAPPMQHNSQSHHHHHHHSITTTTMSLIVHKHKAKRLGCTRRWGCSRAGWRVHIQANHCGAVPENGLLHKPTTGITTRVSFAQTRWAWLIVFPLALPIHHTTTLTQAAALNAKPVAASASADVAGDPAHKTAYECRGEGKEDEKHSHRAGRQWTACTSGGGACDDAQEGWLHAAGNCKAYCGAGQATGCCNGWADGCATSRIGAMPDAEGRV